MMDTIGVLASVVAAITGVILIWNSKGCIVKRLERKERRIYELKQLYMKHYGIHSAMNPNHPICKKISRLEKSVENLKKYI